MIVISDVVTEAMVASGKDVIVRSK